MIIIRKKQIVIVAVIVIAIATIAVFAYLRHKTKPQAKQAPLPTVTITPITLHTSEQTIKAFGTTTSPKSMVVRAQDSAEIQAIYFKSGQLVKKGQILFRLKISDILNQKQRLMARMLQSKSLYVRLLHMNQKIPGIVAGFTLLKAKTQYQQDLTTYKQLLELENVRAPITGRIADTNYAAGDIVATETELTRITDPTSLQVKYQLPSQYSKQARLGQGIKFYPDGTKRIYVGKVAYISPQFDSSSYSLTVRANLNNFADLRPNHFGQVVQTINPHYKTLAIHQGLVHNDAKGFYVYTLKTNKVTKLYFNAGSVNKDGLIQVLNGIKANTMIINSDQSSISPGQTVQVGS